MNIPVSTTELPLEVSAFDSMTLRDWFAGQALAGILAAHAEEGMSFPESERAAKLAYGYADALLKQRTKPVA